MKNLNLNLHKSLKIIISTNIAAAVISLTFSEKFETPSLTSQ